MLRHVYERSMNLYHAYIYIVERSIHAENGVARGNMRKKGVAQTLALAGTLHEPGDINHVQESWNLKHRHYQLSKCIRRLKIGHFGSLSNEQRHHK